MKLSESEIEIHEIFNKGVSKLETSVLKMDFVGHKEWFNLTKENIENLPIWLKHKNQGTLPLRKNLRSSENMKLFIRLAVFFKMTYGAYDFQLDYHLGIIKAVSVANANRVT